MGRPLAVFLFALSPVLAQRTLVLFKAHAATPTMLARLCSLGAARSNSSSASSHTYHVAFLASGGDVTVCSALFPVHASVINQAEALETAWGAATARAVGPQVLALGSLAELTWFQHVRNRTGFHFDYLWALEQDVAWTGNVFDALAELSGRGTEDLLCREVVHGWVGRRHWYSLHNDNWMWSNLHSGWADDSPGAPRVHCGVFAVRYSRRLLELLADEFLSRGRWAHSEWFAPSVCEWHLPGCALGDLLGRRGIGKPFGCCDPPITDAAGWDAVQREAGPDPPRLFHRVKV